MKKSLVKATFVAVFVCAAGLIVPAFGQQRPAAPAAAPVAASPGGSSVAVIDLKYIFEHHSRFQAMRGELMKDVERVEASVKAKQEELRKMIEQLQGFRPGSPEYKQLEAQVANLKAQLQVDVQIQKKEFMEREAKIHYHIYTEVIDELKFYCERNGIQAVLRFNGDQVDPNDPQSILGELNKSVVFYNPAIDITPHILQSINARYEMRQPVAGNPPAGGAAPPAPVNPGTARTPPRQGVPARPQ